MKAKYAILLLVFTGLVGCGNPSSTNNSVAQSQEQIQVEQCDETKLAARDLSGVCRKGTMGALEAVGG